MLQKCDDGWFRFAGGRRWRCLAPDYLCEVDTAGVVPSHLTEYGIADKVRRIQSFYSGRLNFGSLDRSGTALDILVANALTESYGSVPSPLEQLQLNKLLDAHPDFPIDVRLDELLRQIGAQRQSKWLVRFEPGYINPVQTPSRVSVGSHHMLLSTASSLPSQQGANRRQLFSLRDQVIQLAAKSLHSAQLAIEFLNGHSGHHCGELPLIAATYNAGRPRETDANPWHLVQYGAHIDRWLAYYNASRKTSLGSISAPVHLDRSPPPPLALDRRSDLPVGSPLAGRALVAAVKEVASNSSLASADHLSPHFTLAQLTASEKAKQMGINNHPGTEVVDSLRRVADCLEQVQNLLGGKIKINSAYRCAALNRAVGSKSTSMHMLGLAADIVCPSYGSPLKVAQAVASSNIRFDQVIHEFDSWVHIGLAPIGHAERRQQLTIDKHGTRVGLL